MRGPALAVLALAGLCVTEAQAAAEAGEARVRAAQAVAGETRIEAPTAVAVGGVMRVRVVGAEPGAVLERRTGRRWSALRRVPSGGEVAVRVGSSRRQVLRIRGDDGAVSEVTEVAVRPLVLAAGGDVNLGDLPGRLIAERGAGYPWASVGPLLRAADLAFVNLECAVSRRGRPEAKRFTFRGTPHALAGARRAAGLDVLNLANNHTGDFGRSALLDTIGHARRNGMLAVGAGADDDAAYAPRIVERLGLKVAFVGFSEILPFDFRAGPGRPGTAWAFPDRVRAAIREASRRADVVIATFHWGTERDASPSPGQRSLARLALGAGATAVIGAHPHVLQPVERAGAGRLVAYSLGTSCSGPTRRARSGPASCCSPSALAACSTTTWSGPASAPAGRSSPAPAPPSRRSARSAPRDRALRSPRPLAELGAVRGRRGRRREHRGQDRSRPDFACRFQI